uniref:ER lumen protein-retaining receptor n=3 Tax=Percomorphaceae TaxID=1489872 RepID=A0A665X2E0_ECHNA
MPLSWPRPRATSRSSRHFPHLVRPASVCSCPTVSLGSVRSLIHCNRTRSEHIHRVHKHRFASAGAPRNMNIFRLTGDLSHLAAIIILLLKIWKTRSCAGISGKSQVLFALVFTTRYLDLLTSFISLYNTTMKIIYIGCAYATVYLIYIKFKATYDGNHDTFRVEFLVVPVGGLAFLVNHDFSPLEILWTFSIYLESVAILPQLFMISKTGEAETITTHYLFFLGLYRALYLINWIWRFYFEGFFDMIAIVAGVVQTILYCDFFYLYVTKVLKGKKLSLPA